MGHVESREVFSMALISAQNAPKYEIPHEPGEWMRIRPLKASDTVLIQRDYPTAADRLLALLPEMIVEWSYGEPISAAAVNDLDRDTISWLDQDVIPPLLYGRSDEEKKDSFEPSSSTPSRLERRRSRRSSNT